MYTYQNHLQNNITLDGIFVDRVNTGVFKQVLNMRTLSAQNSIASMMLI